MKHAAVRGLSGLFPTLTESATESGAEKTITQSTVR